MRIAINALSARVGSGPNFFNNFLPALAAHDESNQYCVILGESQITMLTAIPERFERRVIRNVPQSFVARALWEQLVLPFHLRRWKVDVLYSSGNVISLLAGCATVVVITNANPFSPLQLDWTRGEKLRNVLLRLFSTLSIKRANKAIFISENSRQIICKKLALPLNNTEVIYYGWSPFVGQADDDFPGFSDYVLTVSVVYPYKNIERLMRAYELLVERHGFPGSLVVAGAIWSKPYYVRLLEVHQTLAHGERIMFTGRVSQEKLASLYKHAHLFVLPSVEETFGIPLQEAMGCGVPIAAADCRLAEGKENCFSPFREVCRDAADYFNPFDEGSICESMHRLLCDGKYRDHLVACGLERIKRFSWDLTAEQTISVFEELKR